jgi:hypothetical protein
MRTGAPSQSGSVRPKSAAEANTAGNIARGTRKWSSRASSQRLARISNISVRAALVTSVACTRPPVRRQINQLSTVPKANSPRSARARAPGTASRIHASLVPEK